MPVGRIPGTAYEDANPLAEDAAQKRSALEKVIESRHKDLVTEREKNYEKTFENTIKMNQVLKDVADAEAEIKRRFEEVDAIPKGPELSEALDELARKISELEKYAGRQEDSLPIYQMRKIQLSMKGHNEMFREKQDKLQPKKKFGFKGRKTKKTEEAPKKEKEEEAAPKKEIGFNGYEVKDRTGETIEIKPEDVNGKDVLLSGLSKCEVRLRGSPSTLHMAKLEGCVVLAGPVATSVFVEGAKGTEFALACQQLRTHNAVKCDFAIHVTSRAIVEDCSEVRFAPYSLDYDDLPAHYALTDLDREVNNWKIVNDFNWLASDKASPNWSLMPEGERKVYKM